MKVAVLVETNRIEIQERAVTEPAADEVLVRVCAVGICGSDTHYFAGMRDHEEKTVYPFVLGHEFSGDVAEVGADVEDVEVGQRVVCAPDRPCGACEWCQKGEYNVCPNVKFAGSGGFEGCLSEYYVVHQSQLHPIPDSLSFPAAALAEPMAIGLHIVDNLVGPGGGETYGILGAGPIGLMTVCGAVRRKPSKIYVSDRIEERLEAALKLGADECVLVPQQDFEKFIARETGGRGVDVVVEAAGQFDAIEQAFRLAANHGTAVIEGIPPGNPAGVDVDAARRRELRVIFGRRSVGKTDEAIELLNQESVDPQIFLTHEFSLEETQHAFEYTRDYRDGVIKAVVKP
jgi:L-iditol 2-dehydrogenase